LLAAAQGTDVLADVNLIQRPNTQVGLHRPRLREPASVQVACTADHHFFRSEL